MLGWFRGVGQDLHHALGAGFHRRFDGSPHKEADDAEQENGQDWPNPDLPLQEDAGPRDRATNARAGPRHVRSGPAVVAVSRFAKPSKWVHRRCFPMMRCSNK